MQHDFYLKAAVLIVGMILSGSAMADLFASNLPQSNCFTVTLVGAQQVQEPPSRQWLEGDNGRTSNTSEFMSDTTEYRPARLGFYLGPANNPPASIVGQDFNPDLAGRIKYGFYLVSTF